MELADERQVDRSLNPGKLREIDFFTLNDKSTLLVGCLVVQPELTGKHISLDSKGFRSKEIRPRRHTEYGLINQNSRGFFGSAPPRN
jgi:hypothetical protein